MTADAESAGPANTRQGKKIEDAAALVAKWLRYFFKPGEVTELRALEVSRPGFRKKHTETGFYDYEHFDRMALEAIRITRHAKGVYFVMNPLRPDILSRRNNRVEVATNEFLASDRDVIERRWVLVDCDPVRDPLISATAEEKAAALEVHDAVKEFLRGCGWPEGIHADSGNGYHSFYRVNLKNTDGSRELVKRALNALGQQFDTVACKVDRKVFNASRIVKMPGTLARKGDDTKDRPHRRAKLLSVPRVQADDLFAWLKAGDASSNNGE